MHQGQGRKTTIHAAAVPHSSSGSSILHPGPETMAYGPRHLVAPFAAFTMAIGLIAYVRYGISTARTESKIRTRHELENARRARSIRASDSP